MKKPSSIKLKFLIFTMKYPFVRFTACTAESNIPESPDRKHAGYIAMHGKMIIKIRNKYNTNIKSGIYKNAVIREMIIKRKSILEASRGLLGERPLSL